MDNEYIIPEILIGAIIYLMIMYNLIRSAVKSAIKDQNYNLMVQNRLLIKMLRKQGVSKKELVDLHNDDNDKFWLSIEE